MISINDLLIKKQVQKYQKTGKMFKSITNHLAPYIYNYPKIVWGMDQDVCSEFFIYILERMEQIILKYKLFDCKFQTWFTIVLRMHFINWKNKISYSQYISSHTHFTFREDIISYSNQQDIVNVLADKIKENIEKLPKKIKIIMKLHFFDLFQGRDFGEISPIFNISLSTLLNRWSKILSEISMRSIKQQEYINKSNEVLYYIFKHKKLLEKPNILDKEQKILQAKIMKLEKRFKALNKNSRKYNIQLSTKTVSEFLDLNINSVYALFKRGKVLLKKTLTESL